MMDRIECNYCGGKIEFHEPGNPPDECPNCLTPIELSDIHSVHRNHTQPDEKCSLEGIVLTYQKTGEKIILDHGDVMVVGREYLGAEVLGRIEQVSRAHCKLEYIDNQYVVSDLDSLNGTFAGALKINCATNPKQKLDENGLLFIGRELFLVNLRYNATGCGEPDVGSNQRNASTGDEDIQYKVVYKCKGCGKEFIERPDICTCKLYGEFSRIISPKT